MKTVPEMLREAAATYEERNKLYGDNYLNFGVAMKGMFPRALTLDSVEDWNRIGVLVQVVSKVTRYAQSFEKGGHDDSLLDVAVYSQMLRELDLMAKKEPRPLEGPEAAKAAAQADYTARILSALKGTPPMTDNEKLSRISEIDGYFEGATGWGSWMVTCANEREKLVNDLNANGHNIEHKNQARTGGGRRVS